MNPSSEKWYPLRIASVFSANVLKQVWNSRRKSAWSGLHWLVSLIKSTQPGWACYYKVYLGTLIPNWMIFEEGQQRLFLLGWITHGSTFWCIIKETVSLNLLISCSVTFWLQYQINYIDRKCHFNFILNRTDFRDL